MSVVKLSDQKLEIEIPTLKSIYHYLNKEDVAESFYHCLDHSSKYSLIQYKGHNSKFKFFDGVHTAQKIFHFFTCILLDYMAHEITKEF